MAGLRARLCWRSQRAKSWGARRRWTPEWGEVGDTLCYALSTALGDSVSNILNSGLPRAVNCQLSKLTVLCCCSPTDLSWPFTAGK